MTKIQEFNNFATDLKQSILWQYNDAKNLISLIDQKQIWYDVNQSGFWGVWTEIVFNLTTADIFGAAIWSIILDVPLLVTDLPFVEQPTWGFNAYKITGFDDTFVINESGDNIVTASGAFVVTGSGISSSLSVGMSVSGVGISPDTVIVSIVSNTIIYISHLMTVDSLESLTFSLDQDGVLDSGSAIVTGLSDTSVIHPGMAVSGTGIPGSTSVLNILSSTSITLSENATETGINTLTFSVTGDGNLTDPGLINTYRNFEQGNFSQFNQNLNLSVEEQRWLLRLRYFQLTTLTNIAGFEPNLTYSINKFLDYLCTDNDINYEGTVYVLDNLDMTITYHFTSTTFPSPLLNALIFLDIWPRPAGVGVLFTGLT